MKVTFRFQNGKEGLIKMLEMNFGLCNMLKDTIIKLKLEFSTWTSVRKLRLKIERYISFMTINVNMFIQLLGRVFKRPYERLF